MFLIIWCTAPNKISFQFPVQEMHISMFIRNIVSYDDVLLAFDLQFLQWRLHVHLHANEEIFQAQG